MRFDPIALLTGHAGEAVLSYRGYYIVPTRSAPGKVRVLNAAGQVPATVGLLVFSSVGDARRAVDRQLDERGARPQAANACASGAIQATASPR